MNNLSGKVAIITGGGYGIGKEIALAYAKSGAQLALAARSPEPLKKTSAEVEKLGARAIAIETDVSKEADCARDGRADDRRLSAGSTSWSTTPGSRDRPSASPR